MSKISSIDDLLMGVGNSQQPATPEHKEKVQEQAEKAEITEDDTTDAPEYSDNTDNSDTGTDDNDDDTAKSDDSSDNEDEVEQKTDEKVPSDDDEDVLDEYGNTKERMSKGMKDRLDRKEKQHQREIEQREREIQALRQQLSSQGASKEVQQAVKDFKYDEGSEGSWEEQLSNFVKHTVKNMANEEKQIERKVQEEQAEREFALKFQRGMDRFGDFKEVVSSQPIDDAMTLALRGMSDPSAFIYAAAKRQPGELERISKLRDPYARMVEMGKLEERMRRNKPTTKAPRPLGKTREDATTKVQPKQKDTTGDDLLAKADAKRLATVKSRHKANR